MCTFSRFVKDEVRAVLVDGVVGEMHAHLIEIIRPRSDIWFSGEPGQSLFEDVQPKWVGASYQHVYPQIELQPINQEGLV